jgi:transaldolase
MRRFVDNKKAQILCIRAQNYYEAQKLKTQVLPASLTSVEEIMALLGVHHITIAPGLLKELAEKPAAENQTKSLFNIALDEIKGFEQVRFVENEKAFRISFTLSLGGEGERKLGQVCDLMINKRRHPNVE